MYMDLVRGMETRNNNILERGYSYENEEELRIGISQKIVITMGNEIRELSNELTSSIWKGMINRDGKK